jgi:hypothetical protein
MRSVSAVILLISIGFVKCGPTSQILNPESVKINGILNMTNDTINLGDTLKYTIALPQTLSTSTSQSININSVQYAFYYQNINIVDTINKLSNLVTPSQLDRFISPGHSSSTGTTVYTTTGNRPFISTLQLIPKVKGLFFIEIISQPGRIKVNDEYETNLFVNFDVANKHHNMLVGVFGPSYQQVLNSLESEGFGRYAFYVK